MLFAHLKRILRLDRLVCEALWVDLLDQYGALRLMSTASYGAQSPPNSPTNLSQVRAGHQPQDRQSRRPHPKPRRIWPACSMQSSPPEAPALAGCTDSAPPVELAPP